MPGLTTTLHQYKEADWLEDNDQSLFLNPWEIPDDHRQPREQRRKEKRGWGDYLEAANVFQFDEEKENDETFDFLKLFE